MSLRCDPAVILSFGSDNNVLLVEMTICRSTTDNRLHAGDNPAVQTERKQILFPVNLNRKVDMQDEAGQTQQNGITAVKISVSDQIKQLETERPPQPKPSILAGKYFRLKEIDSSLKDQNKVILGYEKKRDELKKELSECTGIFKGGRRKELQQEIDSIDIQISNMKKRFSSIVKDYKFDSIQAFYKEFNAAKREYLGYKAACAEYEKIYGDKVIDAMSVRDRLRQKVQMVKERETGRMHQTRQKDKGAR